MDKDYSSLENIFAYNHLNDVIYIGHVPREENGVKKPYFCLGCGRQMQAVKPKTRKDYFKHHVKKNATKLKCSYRDETYRHKLAKEIIQRLKKIKVPAVVKYDPEGKSDHVMVLSNPSIIVAKRVVIEQCVYEDGNGVIHYGSEGIDNKFLLIKPDAMFLNEKDEPILIIEFVATHKPDLEKIKKIKRLGIDAIQILIPKSSPEDIEEAIISISNTKWIFNREEYNATYISNAHSSAGAVPEIDEEQKRLFEEGFKCRSAEIGELIRAINKVLESESYTRTEHNIGREIQRVEENRRREKDRLEQLREHYSYEGMARYTASRNAIEQKREDFARKSEDLETRYFAKRKQLTDATERIELEIAKRKNIRQGFDIDVESIRKNYEREQRECEAIEREAEELLYEEGFIESELRAAFNGKEQSQQSDFERKNAELDKATDAECRAVERNRAEFEGKRTELESNYRRRREHLPALIGAEEKALKRIPTVDGADFEREGMEYYKKYAEGGDRPGGRVAEEHRGIHAFRVAVQNYKRALEQNQRARDGNG